MTVRLNTPRSPLGLMVSIGVMSLFGSAAALADDSIRNTEHSANKSDNSLETVVVTGSRAESRTVAQSLAPIDVISADDLARSGKQNLRDALAAQVPSYTNDAGFTGATGIAVKSATLRGLGGNAVLVLVNGKRRHNTAQIFHQSSSTSNGQSPVDLDLIPVSAVDHIEVLRDGAAAQYGSDAIAGVINIILKSNKSGGQASAIYGQYGERVGHKGNFGATGETLFNQGFELPNDGFFNVSGDVKIQETSNVAGAVPDRTKIYSGDDPREFGESRNRQIMGQPRAQTYSFAYNAELPLTDALDFYSFTTFSHRDSTGFGTYRTANSAQNIPEIYPDGFLPKFRSVEDDYQSVFGLKGKDVLGWDWDLSTSYGRNDVHYHNDDSLNASFGPSSPTDIDNGEAIFSQWANNLDITRSFDTGWFESPLHVASGLEYRIDTYQIRKGEYASYADGGYVYPVGSPNAGKRPNSGSAGWGGFSPEAAGSWDRSNTAGYIDLTQKLTPDWELSVAGRFEHYSDVGDTASGKLSTRYQLTPTFAVRAAVNNGFRAPSLQQQHFSSSTSAWSANPVTGVLSQTVTTYAPPGSPAAVALGSKELKPEKSLNYSFGFVATPLQNLDVTVDFYQIDIKDRILQTSALSGVNDPNIAALLTKAGLSTNQSVAYYGNLADTRTRGIDLVADYRTQYGPYGRGKWTLTSTQSLQEIRDIKEPGSLAGTGVEVLGRDKQGNLTSAFPKNKTSLSHTWFIDDFEVAIKESRFSAVTGKSYYNANRDEKVKPAYITDLDVAYNINDQFKVSVGGLNIFNKRPEQLSEQAKLYYFMPVDDPAYSWYSPYGVDGAYYYARLDYFW
ncbi:TonB-dependent receptor [Pseudomonas sp. 7P_10.2_Bac1]|uniref:TonB-dependent receptor plug domain-containing protein n=1 Tax=Pseudomonas sp. 7P_10.2_Bac1 TaxID=2971614 RepID=UPI0021C92333|nr:TonB-dependent receptor [Pseudomonas sp. 7P_10.2_Bac1]MCU1726868.1 TonB-dependent receptor [Pseudomonas sp. 7P_10.2_Bac1]